MTNLCRHDTPTAVASILAKHAPRTVRSILDPCVGSGALVEPLVSRAVSQKAEVICLDIDREAVETVRGKFEPRLGAQLHVEQADFLSPKTTKSIRERWASIDCILINPPFAGRTTSWRSVVVPSRGERNELKRMAPTEGAFLLHAVSLLTEHGRLLAVLPTSIISGIRCGWIRFELASLGSIVHVHELPRRTFSRIESRVYLLVFERGGSRSKMVLCNHELPEPHRIVVDRKQVAPDCRLDYSHHEAIEWFRELCTVTPTLQWRLLSTVANIKRGDATSCGQKTPAIHTTDKLDIFWQSREVYSDPLAASCVTAGHKDILMARVGRGSCNTAGLATGPIPARFSDCVFRIRAKAVPAFALLFAIRCIFGFPLVRSIVERGTGASYMAVTDLEGIQIPLGLARRYPAIFASYHEAVDARDQRAMRLLENKIRHCLSTRIARLNRKDVHE